jgi:hypothetical protein
MSFTFCLLVTEISFVAQLIDLVIDKKPHIAFTFFVKTVSNIGNLFLQLLVLEVCLVYFIHKVSCLLCEGVLNLELTPHAFKHLLRNQLTQI